MKKQALLGRLPIEPWQRHVFLCLGPDCCDSKQGEEVWTFLKNQLASAGQPILRSKAACLRICRDGPWLLVYPEGVWYGGLTLERCHRIVQEHLLAGRIIEEWATLQQPLCATCPSIPAAGPAPDCALRVR